MSLASPLQLSLPEHTCANGVKEEVVAEGTSGDQPKDSEGGCGGITNSSSKQELLNAAASSVSSSSSSSVAGAQVRRVKWNDEKPLVVSTVLPAATVTTVGDKILQEQLEDLQQVERDGGGGGGEEEVDTEF